MTGKKSYTAPALFRVGLNQEQTILTACSLLATNAMNGAGSFCRQGNCKNASASGMADNGPRSS